MKPARIPASDRGVLNLFRETVALTGGYMTSLALRRGLIVETFDHRELGVIEEIQDDHILLQGRFRRPFWISTVLVRSVDSDRARLHVGKRVLRRYQEPAGDGPTVFRAPLPIVCSFLATLCAAALWIAF